jgi:hypothetical protein
VKRLAATLGAICAVAVAGTAGGQSEPRKSLRARLGVEAARPFLRAESTELRQRAFERLGSAHSSAALGLLARALEPDGGARGARERLVVVRALSYHPSEEVARSALLRAMVGGDATDEPKDALVHDTAALALARSRDPRALELLAQALRQAGRTSETARTALVAHPPLGIEAILAARGAPTESLVGLLGDLGDADAIPLLEATTRSPLPALRAEAIASLFRLDPKRAAAFARELAADRDLGVRVQATRTLVLTRAPEAPARLAALLADPLGSSAALEMALEAKSEDLGATLARARVSDDEREAWLAALGQSGGKAALGVLATTLASPELRWAAAYALALAADDDARDVLEDALRVPAQRRDAVRALALAKARGRDIGDLDEALSALARSRDASDRAAWAFAFAATQPERAEALVRSNDPVIVRAACRNATHPAVAVACGERLTREKDPVLRASLALALAVPDAADRVPNRLLVELLETRGAAAHVAALALAARDDDELRPRVRELLSGTDPILRAHVALGLARSAQPSSVGLLGEAYRFEVEPRVRRAIVTALAARSEPARRVTLELASALDPDPEVRRIAREATRATPSGPLNDTWPEGATESATAWFQLPPAPRGQEGRMLVVDTAGGVSLPLAPDPDGTVVVARIPAGDVRKRIAAAVPGVAAP